ncbi:hypothetical protein CANTEDRAFT_136365 [Yamadazyma tenuis ATCC 10573]|uniref:MFS general substrate transporter n=1 Tax=Candida tenuis (strain ATCC 10573 / BCRC 21748 / CBS 615 / JCM 9827 / NBRC 10315 / NRRL Y-1498 / VKM Y-70) TaxID=590646 RepID=G3B8U3_CANTC|nr:uncharacterized protein CANTEDRAFT_136365 [Yamadazyma tenuis ATCC 10573]EGV62963.1 hypothetical protein CANTEDRAFT_136365 [Yamadazyma tenuis ATCC 10573]
MSSNEEYTPLLGGSLSERQSCDDDTHLEWYKIHLYLQHLQWYKRPNWVFINIVVFLYTLTSIGEPTRKTIRFKLACNSLIEDNGQCDRTKVQLLVSNFDQYSLVVSQFSSVLALATLGSLSNRYGRKPFLCLIPASIFVSRCLLLVSIVNNETFEMSTFLVCDVIASICGSQLGMLGIAKSYVTDIVHPSQRSNSLAFINGALYAGGTLGPMLSNLLSMWLAPDPISHTPNTFQHLSQREVYIQMVEIGLFSVIVVFVAVIVPESRLEHNEESEEPGLDLISPVKTLLRPIFSGNTGYQIRVLLVDITGHTYEVVEQVKLLRLPSDLIPVTLKHRSKELRLQVCVLVLINCLFMLKNSLASLLFQYGIYRYGWDSQTISFFMMTSAFIGLSVLGVIIPFVNEYVLKRGLRLSFKDGQLDSIDKFNIYLGLFSEFAVCTLSGLSTNTTELIASYAICCYTSALVPTVFSTITKFFPPNKTNQVLSTMHIVSALFNTVAPSVFMQIYKFGLLHSIIGLPFFVLGVTCVIPFGLLISSKLIRT